MTEYTTLVLDLDGTLLIGDDLPDENAEAVRAAIAAGYQVVLATARWRQMASQISDELGITGPVIACSGAQVYLPEARKDLVDHRLPEDFTRDLFDLCDSTRCVATVTFSERVLLKLDGEPDRSQVPAEMEWVPRLTGADPDLPRIAAIQGSAVNRAIRDELLPAYSDTVQLNDSIGPNGKIIATITGIQADKGSAMTSCMAHLGTPLSEVIAFGDAENDVAMFRLAGASVAMGQADDATKRVATHVTADNTSFGVAQAIHRLLATGSP